MFERLRSGSGEAPGRHFLGRIAASGLLLTATLIPFAATSASAQSTPVGAESTAVLSVSTIMPADVLLYAETKLDSTSEQYQLLDDVLQRLGSEDSLETQIADQAELVADVPIDMDGAEIGIGLLPVAFLSESGSFEEFPSIGTDTDTEDIEQSIEGVASDAGSQGVLMVIKPTDISAVASELAESSDVDQEGTYLGVEVYVSNNVDDPGAFAVIGDYVAAATNAIELKKIIDASQNADQSLSNNPRFQMASSLLPDERVAFAYANASAVIDLIANQTPQYKDFLLDLLKVFDGDSGLAVVAMENGLRADLVNVSQAGAAVANGNADELDLASKVPANTAVLANGHDLGQSIALKGMAFLLMSSITSALEGTSEDDSATPVSDSATPVPVSVDDTYQLFASLFGFNLKTDLLEQLTGTYGFAAWNLNTESPAEIDAVLVSDVAHPLVVDDVVGTITALIQLAAEGQVSVTSRDIGENSINNVTFPVDDDEMSVDFGMVGDQFMLGLGDGVDTITTPVTDSLADSEIYQTAMNELPTEYQASYFVNIKELQELAATSATPASDSDNTEIFGQAVSNIQDTPAESFAAVTWVENGQTFTSAVLIVP